MDDADIARIVGARVRSLRTAQGLTLDRLADLSGVSRRMIVNVEAARTNASIATLLRLSTALRTTLAELVDASPRADRVSVIPRADQRQVWHGEAGGSAVLAAAADTPDMLELWEWTLMPGEAYTTEAHRAGTHELIHVRSGRLTLTVDDTTWTLDPGDAARFVADVGHVYANHTRRPVRFALTVLEPRT
ncbi:MAG: cupin domain-containing protein [Actinomycetales bacterium]|nr:cupin domain-containing protein [Actinomycetales bacterium]